MTRTTAPVDYICPVITGTVGLVATSILDADELIASFGDYALIGIVVVVFIETGLLFPFLPGDSLLFTGGLLVAQGTLRTPLWLLCLMIFIAAFLGDQNSYLIGRTVGPRLFKNPDARVLKPKYIAQAEAYFEKYGPLTIIIARFIPFVRTFSAVSAGMARMRYRRFVAYDLVGALVWGVGVTVLGYFLGQIAFVREHIDLILIGIIAVSVLPVFLAALRAWSKKRKAARGEVTEDVSDDEASVTDSASVTGPGAAVESAAAVDAAIENVAHSVDAPGAEIADHPAVEPALPDRVEDTEDRLG